MQEIERDEQIRLLLSNFLEESQSQTSVSEHGMESNRQRRPTQQQLKKQQAILQNLKLQSLY